MTIHEKVPISRVIRAVLSGILGWPSTAPPLYHLVTQRIAPIVDQTLPLALTRCDIGSFESSARDM
jgi:hypothetical protein